MELHHEFTVPMGVDDAWTAFNDLERIAPCFPGAAITSVDGDDFTGTAKVKLGPISMQYSGTGTFTERDEGAKRAVISASGKDKRGNGTAGAVITASLHSEGDALTRVVVETDLKITGRPAQFGRGVIEDVGGTILGQFADCLSRTLATSGEPAAAEVPTADVEAATPRAAVQEAEGTAPVPLAAPAAASEPVELDLGSVVGPALLQRYWPMMVAVAVTAVVTAVVTWAVARRR